MNPPLHKFLRPLALLTMFAAGFFLGLFFPLKSPPLSLDGNERIKTDVTSQPETQGQLAASDNRACEDEISTIRTKLYQSSAIRFAGVVIAKIKEKSVSGLTVAYDGEKVFPLDQGELVKPVRIVDSTTIGQYVPVEPDSLEGLVAVGEPKKPQQKAPAPGATNEEEISTMEFPPPTKKANPDSPMFFNFTPIIFADLKEGDSIYIEAGNDFRQDPFIDATKILLVNGLSEADLSIFTDSILVLPPVPTTIPTTPPTWDIPGK